MNRTEGDANTTLTGVGASQGIGVGVAVWWTQELPAIPSRTLEPGETEAEVTRFSRAVADASDQIRQLRAQTAERVGDAEAQIFDAHLSFLSDPAYVGQIRSTIQTASMNAEAACEGITEQTRLMLADIPDDYLRARADDIRDVGNRLLRLLLGVKPLQPELLSGSSIVIADELTPSDIARLPEQIAGIVTARGSKTGHAAIIARTLGIPAVLGLRDAIHKIADGDIVAIDGERGEVTVHPDAAKVASMKDSEQELEQTRQNAELLAGKPAETEDGTHIDVFANIGGMKDAHAALRHGAEGIGLFRTEFLYQESQHWPTEDEQFDAYNQVLSAFGHRPVIIRTLDIGGDKDLPYANFPKEDNPFLGRRAIRLCLANRELFRTQLRALLRASLNGTLWIMFPMVSDISEIREAKRLLQACRDELEREGITLAANIPVGIMVETPAAAIMADVFAREVDFMSIGTNDLTQYTLAADRGNELVSELYQPSHPAVLRLIHGVCKAANRAGIPVGICGELAGDPKMTQVLIGLGVTELSMVSGMIPEVKQRIRTVKMLGAHSLAGEVLEQPDAKAVQGVVDKHRK